ncbi:hypothetical protein BAN20980_04034 [Burkholderia anthina]|uniref:Uncharacterized protein n=2 Tax=Burkholderia anthina TaxID=179879 RepID=A0A6P2GC38_9BURK|nr:hypothetical protein BAN20980_04034 [Burkholderia anthina]
MGNRRRFILSMLIMASMSKMARAATSQLHSDNAEPMAENAYQRSPHGAQCPCDGLDRQIPGGRFEKNSEEKNTYYAKSLGIVGDGVTDTAPAIRAAIADDRTIVFPAGVYLLDSSSGPIHGVADAPAIVINGVRNFGLIGMPGAIFKIGDNLARRNSSFVLMMVSADHAAAGKYTKNIHISGLKLVFNAGSGVKGNISGFNVTSAENVLVENVVFDGSAVTTVGVLGITGTGGRGHIFRKNEFIQVSTAFDNSQYENCRFERNRLIGGRGAVTGFNHFYDKSTLDNIRLEKPLSGPISSRLLYLDNDIAGYPTAFALRGLRDSCVDQNRCHDAILSGNGDRNIISIYTGDTEYSAGYYVSNICVTRNVIYNYSRAGVGVTKGIFVNRYGGKRPVKNVSIVDNTIRNISGSGAIGVDCDKLGDGDEVQGNVVDAKSVAKTYGARIAKYIENQSAGVDGVGSRR